MPQAMNNKRIPVEFYAIAIANFFFWVSIEAIIPLFPLYVISLGASKYQLGLLMGVSSFASLSVQMPVGFIANKVGKQRLILSGSIFQSLTNILRGLVSSFTPLYPITVIGAIANATFNPMSQALVFDLVSSEKRGEAFGIFQTSTGLAMMCGPLLSSFLSQLVNYSTFFLITAIFPLFSFIIYFLFSSRTKKGKAKVRIKERKTLVSLKRILFQRNILLFFIFLFSYCFTLSGFGSFFSLYLSETVLLIPPVISQLFFVRGLANVFIRLPIGKISDRIGRKIPLTLAGVLSVFTLWILPQIQDFILLIPIIALWGIAYGIITTTSVTFLHDNVSSDDRNLGQATMQTVLGVGSMIGSIISGFIVSTFSIPTLFQTLALILTFGVLALILIKTMHDKVL
jgi:predicted MFS family arabinose efflux permease